MGAVKRFLIFFLRNVRRYQGTTTQLVGGVSDKFSRIQEFYHFGIFQPPPAIIVVNSLTSKFL